MTSIRHENVHVQASSSSAILDTADDRCVRTLVSPSGGGLFGPTFSLGGLRSLRTKKIDLHESTTVSRTLSC